MLLGALTAIVKNGFAEHGVAARFGVTGVLGSFALGLLPALLSIALIVGGALSTAGFRFVQQHYVAVTRTTPAVNMEPAAGADGDSHHGALKRSHDVSPCSTFGHRRERNGHCRSPAIDAACMFDHARRDPRRKN